MNAIIIINLILSILICLYTFLININLRNNNKALRAKVKETKGFLEVARDDRKRQEEYIQSIMPILTNSAPNCKWGILHKKEECGYLVVRRDSKGRLALIVKEFWYRPNDPDDEVYAKNNAEELLDKILESV